MTIVVVAAVALAFAAVACVALRSLGRNVGGDAMWRVIDRRDVDYPYEELTVELSIAGRTRRAKYRGHGTVWYVQTSGGWKRAGAAGESNLVEALRNFEWSRR